MRKSTHSPSPSTATRSRYNTKLHAIAEELVNKQNLEDALRAAVQSYVLLENARILTPTGTTMRTFFLLYLSSCSEDSWH
jgi:hypothetical protein